MWWQSGQQEKRRSLLQRLFQPEMEAVAFSRITPPASIPDPAEVISSVSSTPAPADRLVVPVVGIPEPSRAVALSVVQEQLSWTGGSQAERPSSGGSSRPTARARRAGERSRPSLVERLRRALAPSLESLLLQPDTALKWPGELMPFQKEGVRALVNSDRILLADDMGLGKTLQAIVAARILCAQRLIEAILVVAPASLLDQWRRELEKWAPELRAIIVRGPITDRAWQWQARVHVTLVSYETLRSDYGGNKRAPVRRKIWDVVIADEAQRIKNRNATSGALKGLQRRRSWALTGTPLENDEEELASILEFVDHVDLTSSRQYRPGLELLNRHRQLQLRRKKGDVLDDLPPKQVTKVLIPLHTRQKESYDRAEHEGIVYLKSLGAEARVQHVLELITRLKQICNADPATGHSSKLRDIKERLGQLVAQGHRALIFSQYTSATFGVAAAAAYLEAFNPLTFTGDMAQSQRATIIDRFMATDTHKALVLSLRAGGVGLNLQAASYVFHLDRWWNPAVEHQAEDRSHRFGQTAKVNVIKYACTGTIEERIDAILKRKQDLFDQLVDDVSLNLSARLSSEEIFALFGLEPPPHN